MQKCIDEPLGHRLSLAKVDDGAVIALCAQCGCYAENRRSNLATACSGGMAAQRAGATKWAAAARVASATLGAARNVVARPEATEV